MVAAAWLRVIGVHGFSTALYLYAVPVVGLVLFVARRGAAIAAVLVAILAIVPVVTSLGAVVTGAGVDMWSGAAGTLDLLAFVLAFLAYKDYRRGSLASAH